MSEKRRDHKGRLLRTGESQRKDLTYQFRYGQCWYGLEKPAISDGSF